MAIHSGNADLFRVVIRTAGTYTFETAGFFGMCGFAAEEDTALELQTAEGNAIDANDNIDAAAANLCARITRQLEPEDDFCRLLLWPGYREGPQRRTWPGYGVGAGWFVSYRRILAIRALMRRLTSETGIRFPTGNWMVPFAVR